MKPTPEDYYNGIPIDDHPVCEDNLFRHNKIFTGIMREAVCIIDFQNRNFHDVSDHNFFLCGHSRGEAIRMGYKFFDKIIYPDDIYLWAKMHNAILKYLYENEFEEEVLFFTCTIRIKTGIQLGKKLFYMVSFVEIIPVFIENKLKYGLCLFSASAVETPGNLCVYLKGEEIYREYLFAKKKWIDKKMLEFTSREKEILVLYQQGLSRKNIAEKLYVSDSTVKNIINKLKKKCNANNMMEAINKALIHRLIY